jgi:predicted phosphodiesterase
MNKIFETLKKGKYTKREIADLNHTSTKKVSDAINELRNEGINILAEDGVYFVKTIGYREVKRYKEGGLGAEGIFGVESDIHYGSKAERPDAEAYFLDHCKRRGIKIIYNCGDVTDGFNVYPGHINEVKVWGTDNQAIHLIKTRPSVKGIITKFITGNHDLKEMQRTGADVGNLIVNGVTKYGATDGKIKVGVVPGRKDMEYLGQYARDIELPEGVIIRLLHPAKGASYALSYSPQKYIENIRGGAKPDMLLWGHHHDQIYFFRRNIHVLKVPCFQDQTEFTLRRGLENVMGGYAVEYKIRDGHFTSVKPEFVPIYE